MEVDKDEQIDIEFEGVISLKDKEDAQLLVHTLIQLMNSCINLFRELQHNKQAWRPVLTDMIVSHRLCLGFLEVCIDGDIKSQSRDSLSSLYQSIKQLESLFITCGNEYPPNNKIPFIIGEFNNFLHEMAAITDYMETDQIFRIKKCCKIVLYQLVIVREANNDVHLELKLENIKDATEYLHHLITNRISILPPSPTRGKLTTSQNTIKYHSELLLISSYNYLSLFDNQSRENQIIAITSIANGIKEILECIDQTKRKSFVQFNSQNLLQKLRDLEMAIYHRRSDQFIEQAKLFIEEINFIRDRVNEKLIEENNDQNCEALNESCEKLRFMTRSLLSSARNALDNPNDDQSQFLLRLAVSGLPPLLFSFF